MRSVAMIEFNNKWDDILSGEFSKDYYINLRKFLIDEYKNKKIYPNMYDIFNALKLTSYEDVKIVILGQDPYHGENQAHGLAFSVNKGIKIPPSLLNMYKELQSDLGCFIPNNGYLVPWAEQGVLLSAHLARGTERNGGGVDGEDELPLHLGPRCRPLGLRALCLGGDSAQHCGRPRRDNPLP